MSAREAGYGAIGGTRKSSAATITPFLARASFAALPFRRSPRTQAPPCSSTMIGNGPLPRGLKRRASSGLSPCRRYSTSATSMSYAVCVPGAMRVSLPGALRMCVCPVNITPSPCRRATGASRQREIRCGTASMENRRERAGRRAMKKLVLESTAPFQGLPELVAYDEGLFEKEGLHIGWADRDQGVTKKVDVSITSPKDIDPFTSHGKLFE